MRLVNGTPQGQEEILMLRKTCLRPTAYMNEAETAEMHQMTKLVISSSSWRTSNGFDHLSWDLGDST